MPSTDVSRRRALTAGCLVLAGLAGCLANGVDSGPNATPTESSPDTTETGDSGTSISETDGTGTNTTEKNDGGTGTQATNELPVTDVAVSDFIEYPLAGVHPHVHARPDVQYVVVRVDSSLDDERVRDRVSLQLDESAVQLADRQPVPWEQSTDLAFAVPKDEQYETGRVVDGGTTVLSLSSTTLDRLNHPPRFRVSDLGVSPAELPAGQQTTATVRATVTNDGEGPGTFGASLQGNYTSGSATVTVRLDAGESQELSESLTVVGGDGGDGDEAVVRVDWGRDEWSTTIPVGETTTTASPTASER
jgi:hypothetical protein